MSAGLGTEVVTVVNRLQDAFTAIGANANAIDLPQICVLGSQSSGKSSVLENVVGRDFLPRGTGIVTRRPLVLQLINRPTPSGESTDVPAAVAEAQKNDKAANAHEWGEFLHLPNEKFYDFDKIRAEIVRDTEAKTGKNAGISPQPINLRIFSPNVLTLTLVDLPGLTKVPVGDQPRDIEKQIRDMLLRYISKPSCVILAVTAANTDIANSDALKMAREVDPDGLRTIGVLTKIDLMDSGTDVIDILAGRVIHLRLGYVPVINRGQRDIESKKAISAALEYEKQFFENHPSYRGKAAYCGTPFLAKKLNSYLIVHIKTMMPAIKERITQQLSRFNTELASLGGPMGGDAGGSTVLSVITEFCTDFRAAIDGNITDLTANELSGGARISFVYHELFTNGIKTIDPFDQVQESQIRTLLYNSSGSTPNIFVGTSAFEIIVKQQIRRLEEPSLKCCQLVYDELIRILSALLGKIGAFKRYPALKDRMNSVVINFFKTAMQPTTKLVTDMVNMQACYVNTTHPDFINGHKAMAIVNDRMNANKPQPANGAVDPKRAINNNKDLDVEAKKEEQTFFGSFWNKAKGTPQAPAKKGAAAMEVPANIRPQASLSDRETMETEVIKLLINSYYNIVKREMMDMVPKSITYTLVNHSKDGLQQELLQELYKPEVLSELMKESEHVVARRKECVTMISALNRAEEIVASV